MIDLVVLGSVLYKNNLIEKEAMVEAVAESEYPEEAVEILAGELYEATHAEDNGDN